MSARSIKRRLEYDHQSDKRVKGEALPLHVELARSELARALGSSANARALEARMAEVGAVWMGSLLDCVIEAPTPARSIPGTLDLYVPVNVDECSALSTLAFFRETLRDQKFADFAPIAAAAAHEDARVAPKMCCETEGLTDFRGLAKRCSESWVLEKRACVAVRCGTPVEWRVWEPRHSMVSNEMLQASGEISDTNLGRICNEALRPVSPGEHPHLEQLDASMRAADAAGVAGCITWHAKLLKAMQLRELLRDTRRPVRIIAVLAAGRQEFLSRIMSSHIHSDRVAAFAPEIVGNRVRILYGPHTPECQARDCAAAFHGERMPLQMFAHGSRDQKDGRAWLFNDRKDVPLWLFGASSYNPRLAKPLQVQQEASAWIIKGGSAVLLGDRGSGKRTVVDQTRLKAAATLSDRRVRIEWDRCVPGSEADAATHRSMLASIWRKIKPQTIVIYDDDSDSARAPSQQTLDVRPLLSETFSAHRSQTQLLLLAQHMPSRRLIDAYNMHVFHFGASTVARPENKAGEPIAWSMDQCALQLFPHIVDHTGALSSFYHERRAFLNRHVAQVPPGTHTSTQKYWSPLVDAMAQEVRRQAAFRDLWPSGVPPFTLAWRFAEAYEQTVDETFFRQACRVAVIRGADPRLIYFPPGLLEIIDEYRDLCVRDYTCHFHSSHLGIPSNGALHGASHLGSEGSWLHPGDPNSRSKHAVDMYRACGHSDADAFAMYLTVRARTLWRWSGIAIRDLAVFTLCETQKSPFDCEGSGVFPAIETILTAMEREWPPELVQRTAQALALLVSRHVSKN